MTISFLLSESLNRSYSASFSFSTVFLNQSISTGACSPPGGPLGLRRRPRARPELNSQARFSITINSPYYLHHSDARLAGSMIHMRRNSLGSLRIYMTIKTKSRNRLDVRSDIHLAVSKTKPNRL